MKMTNGVVRTFEYSQKPYLSVIRIENRVNVCINENPILLHCKSISYLVAPKAVGKEQFVLWKPDL